MKFSDCSIIHHSVLIEYSDVFSDDWIKDNDISSIAETTGNVDLLRLFWMKYQMILDEKVF